MFELTRLEIDIQIWKGRKTMESIIYIKGFLKHKENSENFSSVCTYNEVPKAKDHVSQALYTEPQC